MRRHLAILMVASALAAPAASHAQTAEKPTDPSRARFLALYKEMVETDTTYSVGSCTLAAEQVAARLKAAGFPDADVHVLVPDGKPRFGALAAILHGTDKTAPPLLLLAHIDVVEAKRSDWKRDPFKLIEEDGYYYGRGTNDDKAMAASFADILIRYRQEGFQPRRDIKLALTCGEETSDQFDGAQYLTEHDRWAVQAGMALNEGGAGLLDDQGRPLANAIQAGEKIYQDYRLVVTNLGGHSSRPRKDNAVYQLAHALVRLEASPFPVRLSPVTRAYFTAMASLTPDPLAADLRAMGGPNLPPADVLARVAQDPAWNSTMRTTCVATQVNAGHAPNALAQHAEANVNCRILPDETVEQTRLALEQAIDDKDVVVSLAAQPSPQSPAPPLTDAVLGPARQVSNQIWPSVPLIPTMATGGTDGAFTNAAGIPTYGLGGIFRDPDGDGIHGLNERIRIRSLYDSREFLYRVVRLYASTG